jgi:multidrug efflux system membrane fusion protein
MAVITQMQPIAVLFTIPEDSLNSVLQRFHRGERLPAEAYDRSGQNKLVAGRLLTIDNQIDPATGTNRLKAVFENKEGALFPNQFVNIRLLVETQRGKVLIPAVAIQRGPQGTFVYVVKPDQTVEVRQVTTGTMEGSDAAVESGLSAGDQVVIDGVDKLQAGSKVQLPGPSRGGGPSGGGRSRGGQSGGGQPGSNPQGTGQQGPNQQCPGQSGPGRQGAEQGRQGQ